MAATITKQVLVNGSVNLVINVHIDGDAGGDVSAALLIDMSAYAPVGEALRLMEVESHLSGFSAEFLWDATTPAHAFVGGDGEYHHNYNKVGGLINDGGAGVTGDMLITTSGLTTNKFGNVLLSFKKKNAN